jgi:hypothetical protein
MPIALSNAAPESGRGTSMLPIRPSPLGAVSQRQTTKAQGLDGKRQSRIRLSVSCHDFASVFPPIGLELDFLALDSAGN